MALFPKCSFSVSGSLIVPGTHVEAVLVVKTPEPIPRAEHIDLVFRSVAWAAHGEGNQRRVERRTLFEAPFRVDVVEDPLPAGTHRFPFAMDVPAWLPPGYAGYECAIEHFVEARIDVDWAVDPVSKIFAVVAQLPREGARAPLIVRSPPGIHESIVLEVTLSSAVIRHDEPLIGQIALRGGHDARFDAVELSFRSLDEIAVGFRARRTCPGSVVRIAKEALRSGEAVDFQFAPDQATPPGFRSSFINHDVILSARVKIPWASDPLFDVLLDVLPAGSVIHGDAGASFVGSERLRRLAAWMAEGTGLREGRPPTLVEGSTGPVAVRIVDAPRGAGLGIDVEIVFPDVELGIECRPAGLLDGLRESPLLPRDLAHRYFLRCHSPGGRPAVDESLASAFIRTLLADLPDVRDLRLSDHHFGATFAIPNDDPARMVEIARGAQARVTAIVLAIGRLPFPASVAPSRPAWEAAAAEQGALLVPTGPSLYGLTFRARVLAGEERTIGASFCTKWGKSGPSTHVEVDLRGAPLPKDAWPGLESEAPSERFRAVRGTFSSAHVTSDGQGVMLDRDGFADDPRALLSAIETFFDCVLDARRERRADAPYR